MVEKTLTSVFRSMCFTVPNINLKNINMKFELHDNWRIFQWNMKERATQKNPQVKRSNAPFCCYASSDVLFCNTITTQSTNISVSWCFTSGSDWFTMIYACLTISQCFTSFIMFYEYFMMFNKVLLCLVSKATISIGACTISNSVPALSTARWADHQSLHGSAITHKVILC